MLIRNDARSLIFFTKKDGCQMSDDQCLSKSIIYVEFLLLAKKRI